MRKASEMELQIISKPGNHTTQENKETTNLEPKKFRWWLCIIVYTIFILFGQSATTLLGRLYYEKGGKSVWVETVAQLAGFPILLPFYYVSLSPPKNPTQSTQMNQPSALILALAYFCFGILLAANTMLYSIGLLYLPVSTFSLICASQLAFNAVFSFFLHSQKFTPFIINSLFLLTISSTLLIFQTDTSNRDEASKEMYAVGFICTISASAGYGLMLSLTQLFFKRILKGETQTKIFEMMIYQSMVAVSAALFGLFISGEWRGLSREMEEFELGMFSYKMLLVEMAIASQIFVVGTIGLISEVSSLFSNAISVLGLPVIPILAVIFFHDRMNAIKIIALVLAIWGFLSYAYQCYLDDKSSKNQQRNGSEVSSSLLLAEVS